jgi:hypothetical protein
VINKNNLGIFLARDEIEPPTLGFSIQPLKFNLLIFNNNILCKTDKWRIMEYCVVLKYAETLTKCGQI